MLSKSSPDKVKLYGLQYPIDLFIRLLTLNPVGAGYCSNDYPALTGNEKVLSGTSHITLHCHIHYITSGTHYTATSRITSAQFTWSQLRRFTYVSNWTGDISHRWHLTIVWITLKVDNCKGIGNEAPGFGKWGVGAWSPLSVYHRRALKILTGGYCIKFPQTLGYEQNFYYSYGPCVYLYHMFILNAKCRNYRFMSSLPASTWNAIGHTCHHYVMN